MSKPAILDLLELKQPELIRVGISENYTIKSSEDREEFQLKYNATRYSSGTGLTLNSSGGIVIGDNINTVLVNLHVYFSDASKTGETKSLFIRRNAGGVNNKPGTMTSRVDFNRAQTTLETFAIIPVEKGDVITAGVVASQNDVIQATSTNNFFEIAKLN